MIARLPLPSEGQWLSDDLVGQGQGKSPEEGPSRQTLIAVRLLSKIDLRRPRDGHGITKGLPGEVARPELHYALPDSIGLNSKFAAYAAPSKRFQSLFPLHDQSPLRSNYRTSANGMSEDGSARDDATEARSSSVSGSSSSGAARIASSTGSANARSTLHAAATSLSDRKSTRVCNSWRSISSIAPPPGHLRARRRLHRPRSRHRL